MTDPVVTVLSLNYRNALQSVKCATSFLNQTMVDQMEILIIDNDSQDDSVGILRNRLPQTDRVRLIETPENKGFGSGYNTGARYANGTYLLFNNPDKIIEPDGVERLVKKMESDSSIGILAPKLLHHDGTRRYSVRRFPTLFDCVIKRTFMKNLFPKQLEKYLQLDLNPEETRAADWVIGGCFMIRKDFFEEIGGFDDRFFLFFEDIDICRRCALHGKKVIYFPEVSASDKKRRLSDGGVLSMIRSKVGRAHIHSAIKYFWKWKNGPRLT